MEVKADAKLDLKVDLKTCPACLKPSLTRFCGNCGAAVWAPEPGKPDPDGWGPGQPRTFSLDISNVQEEDLKKLVKGKITEKEIDTTSQSLCDKLQAAGAVVIDIKGTRLCKIPDEAEMDGTPIEVVINGVRWFGTMQLTYDEFANVKNLIHNRKIGDLHSRYGDPQLSRKVNLPMLNVRGNR